MRFIGGSLHGKEVPDDVDMSQLMVHGWTTSNSDRGRERYVLRLVSDADGVRYKCLVLNTIPRSMIHEMALPILK